jgi:hypothetical protein
LPTQTWRHGETERANYSGAAHPVADETVRGTAVRPLSVAQKLHSRADVAGIELHGIEARAEPGRHLRVAAGDSGIDDSNDYRTVARLVGERVWRAHHEPRCPGVVHIHTIHVSGRVKGCDAHVIRADRVNASDLRKRVQQRAEPCPGFELNTKDAGDALICSTASNRQ